ncbi:class I glutamine amidotransferase-like protein [Pilobolus umbonatus]|nr:class I glutamine amidotransferase-like protein [Pilobolus umbonatus]
MSLPRKALIAITSYHETFYEDGKKTGLFFSEALHPFQTLTDAGFEVAVASETGTFGFDEHSIAKPFLSDEDSEVYQNSSHPFNTLLHKHLQKASEVNPSEYGLFFAAGGHGCIYDFPSAKSLQHIAEEIYSHGGVVSAVCHGPAILPGIKDTKTGKPIIQNKTVTGFSTKGEEDMGLMKKMNQDKVNTIEADVVPVHANYVPPPTPFEDYVKVDGRVITGANPASAHSTAKSAINNSLQKGAGKASEGHPWRNWRIKVVAVDDHKERRGKLSYLLDHVEYVLHPTFVNPVRVFTKEPYLLQERGWGEFDMRVVLYFKNNMADPENIYFDLHFRDSFYTIMHKIIFRNPYPDLIRILSLELPSSDTISNNNAKKRRTSPVDFASKTLKLSPTLASPLLFNNDPLTPAYHNINTNIHSKYPISPVNHYRIQPSPYRHQQEKDYLQMSSNESDDIYSELKDYKQNIAVQGGIVEDIYSEEDIDSLNPIHSQLDTSSRAAWGIPSGLNMLELARRLSSRTSDQAEEIEILIKTHRKEGAITEENDDEFVVDLYSLGPELLTLLWDYTEKKMSTQATSAISPFSLVQANTSIADD